MKIFVLIFLCYFITSNGFVLGELINFTPKGSNVAMKRLCVFTRPEFRDIIVSDCFVDKSLLIMDFFEYVNSGCHFIRITAPKGFGKTVNLKMLRAFLQTENGRITSSPTQGCSMIIKHNLHIFKQYPIFFSLHCGKYPVIYITFKKTMDNNFSGVINAFRDIIHDAFLQHGYLLDSTHLNSQQKFRIPLYTDQKLYKNLHQEQIEEALYYLSKLLYLHYGKEVIVLIDDFDAPVWKLLSTDFPVSEVQKTIYFITFVMVNLVENNRYVQSGFINDCVRLSKVYVPKLKGITSLDFMHIHPFVRYYGLTGNQVRAKLNYFKIQHKYEDVKAYYNGYLSKGYDDIYSTWSIMNFLQTEDLKDYWIAPDGLNNLSSVFLNTELQKSVLKLLHRNTIEVHSLEPVSIGDIMLVRDIMTGTRDLKPSEVERFLLFLSHNGYLVSTPRGRHEMSLKIPNNQIYHQLCKQCTGNCSL